jgi:SAM-dependent methyltransferase
MFNFGVYVTIGVAVLLAVLVHARSRTMRQQQFAALWKFLSPRADSETSNRKRALLAGVGGDVVEIGPGVGANAAYFDPSRIKRLTLAEPNEFMHLDLAESARRARFQPAQVVIVSSSASHLPLPTASQDSVVCTLVLCSADDPGAVIREALRVLRPGGRLIFLEHVVANTRSRPFRALLQRFVMATGLWSAFGDGCELTRDTAALLRREAAAGGRCALSLSEIDVGGCSAMAVLAGSQIEGFLTKV